MSITLEDFTAIESWTEADLEELPAGESDDYEYKSSLIATQSNYRAELADKITKTASAFWNTGGGIFVVGMDDKGKVDGGIPKTMGKTNLRDWVDQVLMSVVPVGPYSVKLIEPASDASPIPAGQVVLVVAFGESYDLPHMAPDYRYYVRTGAHSNPANHYLVEAIRARRGLRRPLLRGLLREHQRKIGIIELVIVAVNDLPALNVEIDFEPLPIFYAREYGDSFPLRVPIIERDNPFRIDVATFQNRAEWFGNQPVTLKLSYEGIRGKVYYDQQQLDPLHSLSPAQFRTKDNTNKPLRKLSKQIRALNSLLENRLTPDVIQALLAQPNADETITSYHDNHNQPNEDTP
jgi:hypothetical protein